MLVPAQTYQNSWRSNLSVCFWALVSSKNAKIRLRPPRSKKNGSKILLISGIKLKYLHGNTSLDMIVLVCISKYGPVGKKDLWRGILGIFSYAKEKYFHRKENSELVKKKW